LVVALSVVFLSLTPFFHNLTQLSYLSPRY
jgi:hypothetical protein